MLFVAFIFPYINLRWFFLTTISFECRFPLYGIALFFRRTDLNICYLISFSIQSFFFGSSLSFFSRLFYVSAFSIPLDTISMLKRATISLTILFWGIINNIITKHKTKKKICLSLVLSVLHILFDKILCKFGIINLKSNSHPSHLINSCSSLEYIKHWRWVCYL